MYLEIELREENGKNTENGVFKSITKLCKILCYVLCNMLIFIVCKNIYLYRIFDIVIMFNIFLII